MCIHQEHTHIHTDIWNSANSENKGEFIMHMTNLANAITNTYSSSFLRERQAIDFCSLNIYHTTASVFVNKIKDWIC